MSLICIFAFLMFVFYFSVFSPPFPPPGLVSHSDLDDRAIEALKEFNEEGALHVLLQFKDSDLSHVQVCATRGLLNDRILHSVVRLSSA